MDEALSEWFRQVRAMNILVSGPLLEENAHYFAEHLWHENLKSSNGFLDKFKEKHEITDQVVCEEKNVDLGIVETLSERLSDILIFSCSLMIQTFSMLIRISVCLK